MRLLVALVVLVTAVIAPMARSFMTVDHACCPEQQGTTDHERRDDDDRDEPSRCADRGCCVVGCRVVESANAPVVGIAPVAGVMATIPTDELSARQPVGGIYRPPR